MKNFFKKLSFVLAIAMVLTSIAPATASAAVSETNVPVKKVNVKYDGEKVDSINLDVEETKTIKLGLPVTKAAKAAGFTKTTFATAVKVADDSVVEVVKVSKRLYEITGVAAGETTITFGAAKTKKLAKAGEFKKEATLTVVVEAPAAELTAKQSGVQKITVTGANLTDKVADYTVKRGTVTVSVEKVIELSEDKTSAVLVASSTKYPKGNYTVKFGEETTAEFTVEDGKLDAIVIDEHLVLDGQYGVCTSASVSYKALNQFEEDITKTTTSLNATCTLGLAEQYPDSQNGKIKVNNISTYNTLGATGKVIVFDTAGSGVSVEADVTLSSMSVPAEITVNGIWDDTNKKYVDLAANKDYTKSNLYLAVNAIDQYNNPVGGFDADAADGNVAIIVNPGLTGFALDTAAMNANACGFSWDAMAILVPVNSLKDLKAGDVSFTFVLKGAIKNVSGSITVAATQKVASIDVYPLDTVYAGEETKFGYTAFDTDGNEVTSFDLLSDEVYGITYPEHFKLRDDNYDGVAELYLLENALTDVPAGTSGYYSGMFGTADYSSTKTVQFSYSAAAKPAYVLGVKSDVALGVVSGKSIELGIGNLRIADQYGRVMTKFADDDYAVKVEAAPYQAPKFAMNVATPLSLTSDAKVKFDNINGTGTETFVLSLTYKGEVIKNSEANVTLLSTTIPYLSNFSVKDLGTLYIGDKTSRTEVEPEVYGVAANGIKVAIPAEDGNYTIVSEILDATDAFELTTASVTAVGKNLGQVAEKDYAVKVIINNKEGSVVNTSVKVACADPAVSNVFVDIYGTNFVKIDVATITTGTVSDVLLDTLNGVDQYGYKMIPVMGESMKGTGYVASVQITDLVSANGAVDKNNTTQATVSNVVAEDTFVATLTFAGGYTYTVKVVVK